MKNWLVLAVVLFSTILSGRAEDLSGEVDFGGQFVQVLVGPQEWLNGAKIETEAGAWLKLKPGDTLVVAVGACISDRKPMADRTFEAYHMDRFVGKEPWFTHYTFSVRTEPYGREGVRVFPDKVIKVRSQHGVTPVVLIDGGEWDFIPIGYHLGQSARTK